MTDSEIMFEIPPGTALDDPMVERWALEHLTRFGDLADVMIQDLTVVNVRIRSTPWPVTWTAQIVVKPRRECPLCAGTGSIDGAPE